MIAKFRRRLRSDRGITVVELAVYMLVAAIVLALSGMLYVNVARGTKNAVDQRSSTAEAQNIIDVMASDIRAATNVPVTSTSTTWAVLAASPSSLTIITYTDAGPVFSTPYQVQFTTDASGRMVLYQWNPPGAGLATFPRAGGPTVSRYLGGGVQNPTTVFKYLDANGNEIPSTGGMNPSQYANVTAIVVSLTVTGPNTNTPITLTNTIWMPNAGSTAGYAGAN